MRLPMRAGYADPQGTHAVAAAVDMSSGSPYRGSSTLGPQHMMMMPSGPLPRMPGFPGMTQSPGMPGLIGSPSALRITPVGPTFLPQKDGSLRAGEPSCQSRTRLDDIVEVESSRASENTLRTSGFAQERSRMATDRAQPTGEKLPEAQASEAQARYRRAPSSAESSKRDIRPCVVGISWSKPRKSREASSHTMRSLVREGSLSADVGAAPGSRDSAPVDHEPAFVEKPGLPAPTAVRHFSMRDARPQSASEAYAPGHVEHADIPIQPTSAGTWPRVAPRIDGRHTSSGLARTDQGDGCRNPAKGGFDIRMYSADHRVVKTEGRSRSTSGVSFFSVAEAL